MIGSNLTDASAIVWIIAGCVAVITAVAAFIKWVRAQFNHASAEAGRPVMREEIKAALEPIIVELTTNGGSSLRDAVNRTESSLAEHRSEFNDHVIRDDIVAARVELLGIEVRNIQQASVHPDYPADKTA